MTMYRENLGNKFKEKNGEILAKKLFDKRFEQNLRLFKFYSQTNKKSIVMPNRIKQPQDKIFRTTILRNAVVRKMQKIFYDYDTMN